jgi:hypothetical protein
MEMIYYGCYALDYTTHIHGRYQQYFCALENTMKVAETCEEDECERQRGWLVLREMNAEKKFYERIGVIKMPLSHQYTAVMEMW